MTWSPPVRLVSLFLLTLFALRAAPAEEIQIQDIQPEAQYLRQRWTAQDGLPGSPNTIAQTPDGYLWAGTDQGLLRFNGQEWLLMVPEEKSLRPLDHIIALTLDAHGVLWIWMEGTRVLRYENGAFHEAFATSVEERAVTALARANNGDAMLSRAGQHIVQVTSAGAQELGRSPGPIVVSLAQTTNGRVWLGTRNLGLFYLDGKKPVALAAIPSDIKVNCLLASHDNRLWIGLDHGLALWDGTKIQPLPAPLDTAQIRALTEDREGNLWVGTEQGLIRFDGRHAYPITTEANAITSLFTDREGNVWFADAHGIERLRHRAFLALSGSRGFPAGIAGPIYTDPHGAIWFAMKKGGLYVARDGAVTQVTTAGLDHDIVYSIAGRGDDIWLARQRGGLTHLHEGALSETFQPGDAPYKDILYTVHVNRDGSVWAGTLTGGAIQVANGVLTRYPRASGLGSDSVEAIEESADGTMWFATHTRLSSLSRGQWSSFFERDGLPSPEITSLLDDGHNGLWIGTAAGLAHLANGKIKEQFHKDPLLGGTILGLARDQSGALWVSTTDKVFSIDANTLASGLTVPVPARIYSASDGLLAPGGVRRSQSLVAHARGHIWLSTPSGLSVVDASIASTAAEPTIAHIETARIDGTARALGFNQDLTVPAGRKRLELSFVGLNLSAPETVRYRYKLDNFDAQWSEPGTQRAAIYTNLPPGSYTFHIAATNREGGWSGHEAYLPIVVKPLLWQMIEFRVACVLAILLAALLLYQLRMQQMAHRANLIFEERLAERTRIAQELHDTLLQGFFSASMQLSVVTETMPVQSPARAQLKRLVEMMGRVLDDGRNAVQGLRTARVSTMDLDEAIRTTFEEASSGHDFQTRPSIEISGTPRELRPGVQHELLRIVQEALCNACKHAHANRIAVAVAFSSSELQIHVRDDGQGIDPIVLAEGRPGHWGLQGMRERATKLGAKLSIQSNLNTGTTVSIAIPGAIAFRRYAENSMLNRAIEFSRTHAPTKYPFTSPEDSSAKSE